MQTQIMQRRPEALNRNAQPIRQVEAEGISTWTIGRILSLNLQLLGMSKETLAERVDVSLTTVGNWLSDAKGISDGNLRKVASVLDLTDPLHALLQELAYSPGRPHPSTQPSPEALRRYVSDYQRIAESIPYPTYASDHAWRTLACNQAFRNLVKDVGPDPGNGPEENFMRFSLFHPHAERILLEHRSRWLVHIFAKLNKALQLHSNDPVLRDILDGIQRRPGLLCAYEQEMPALFGPGDGRIGTVHADGLVAPMRNLHHGAVDVRVVVTRPLRFAHLGYREVTFLPITMPDP